NLPEALQTVEMLKFHGVGVYYISQGIDTLQDKIARQMITVNGMMDEHYLAALAEKVHRGAEGRVLKGLNPGGKCYGYFNVPILSSTRTGKYGMPAVDGVQQKINPEQAQIVLRVFQMQAQGIGITRIAKTLNAERVPPPQSPRRRERPGWHPSAIREMLRNELYRGVRVWNRTVKTKNPGSGSKVSKARPRDEWRTVEVPELRIVSQELWDAVHARIKHVNEKLGIALQGGFNCAKHVYLFSGLLVCGDCGSRIIIISGGNNVRYGCPGHRR